MRAEDFAVLDVDLNISGAPITKKFFNRCDETPRDDAVRDLETAHRLDGFGSDPRGFRRRVHVHLPVSTPRTAAGAPAILTRFFLLFMFNTVHQS